jgi:hypothetical protein
MMKNQLDKKLKNNMLIMGGHFMIKKDKSPNLNQGTIESFRTAAELYKTAKKKGYYAGLGLFINDIGMTCSTHNCSFKKISREDFLLPDQYLDILSTLEINPNELKLFWEKHMRNRGKREMKRQLKKQVDIREEEGNYYLMDPEGYVKILLTRARNDDKYGNASCSLIMAALFQEQQRRGFDYSLNIYYIGYDNIGNIPNYHIIEKGKKVADRFGITINVNNVYIGNEGMYLALSEDAFVGSC